MPPYAPLAWEELLAFLDSMVFRSTAISGSATEGGSGTCSPTSCQHHFCISTKFNEKMLGFEMSVAIKLHHSFSAWHSKSPQSVWLAPHLTATYIPEILYSIVENISITDLSKTQQNVYQRYSTKRLHFTVTINTSNFWALICSHETCNHFLMEC